MYLSLKIIDSLTRVELMQRGIVGNSQLTFYSIDGVTHMSFRFMKQIYVNSLYQLSI